MTTVPKLAMLAMASSVPFTIQAQQANSLQNVPAASVVEIKGRGLYDPRADDTASKIVIGHDEVIKYGDSNLLDVMKRLPGITVRAASVNSQGAEIQMRGLGSGYTQVLIDGVRKPDGLGIETLNPASVERIEILRAASAEFSTRSIAGTINIVLKRAVSTANNELKFGHGIGKNGTRTPALNLSLSDKVGRFAYSVESTFSERRSEQSAPLYEEYSGDASERASVLERNNSEKDSFGIFSLSPRLTWKLEDGDTFDLNFFVNSVRSRRRTDSSTTVSIGEPPGLPQIEQRTGYDESFAKTDLIWSHRTAEGAQLQTLIGISYSRDTKNNEWLGFASDRKLRKSTVVVSSGSDKTVNTTGKYSRGLGAGHFLSAGWDVSHTGRKDNRSQYDSPLAASRQKAFAESYTANVASTALYAQDEWAATPNLSTYLGARWEQIAARATGTNFANVSSAIDVLHPIFQVLYKLPSTKGDQLRFAAAQTFMAPGTRRLLPNRVVSANNSALDPDTTGNPQLQPQRATGFDASFEHRFDASGALLSVSTSTRKIRDVIREIVSQGPDGRWVSRPVNRGTANTQSMELEIKLPAKMLWETTLPLELRTSYSRNWSQVDYVSGPNNRLAAQTPYSATFGIDYTLPQVAFGGAFVIRGGGLVQMSDRQMRYDTVHRDIDLFALWTVSPKTKIRASGSLGQSWRLQDTYADAGRAAFSRTQTVPSTASARIMLEHTF